MQFVPFTTTTTTTTNTTTTTTINGEVATIRQGRETSAKIRFMQGLPQEDALCPSSSVAPAGNGGIPVIQAYRSQSHRSPVYRRPEGFCCLREQAEPSAEGD